MQGNNRPFEIMGLEECREWGLVELKDRYAYRPEKGFALIQRACLWVLRKIGCAAVGEELKVTRQLIRPGDVAAALMEQAQVAREVFHKPGGITRVCLGPEQYRELMRSEWVVGYTSFRGYANGGVNGRPVVFGLDVTVVPWMDGILVLPD